MGREEKRDATAVSRWPFLVLTDTSICRERSFPNRFAKILFGIGCFSYPPGGSGGFENQDAAVVQMDFRCFPCGTLVEPVWVRLIWIPGTVEPVEIRFVVGDPFLDRLPGRFDRLHGLDVEGWRRRARECDDSLPETVEAEEEFNFLAADDFADGFHDALAAGALERVAAPNLEDEVAPEGAHVAGGLFRRRGDEKDFRLWIGDFGFRIGRIRGTDDAVGDERGLAAGFVGVGAVVADGLLAFGREVEQCGGDEVGGFEDLEVPFGGVVALGAVDDGLGAGVPGDFLEGEGMAEEILGEAFASGAVVGGNGFLAAVVDVEAGVFPGEEVGKFSGADELGFAQGVEEAVAEEFDGRFEVFGGHAVEMAVGGEEAVGSEDMEVRVEDQVIAEGVDGGDGSEFAVGEIEAGAEGVAEGFGGGVEEVAEELAAFAEDAA